MGLVHSPIIDRTNLVLHYDADNPRTFPNKQENLITNTSFNANGGASWDGYCGNKNNITYNTTEVVAPDGTNTAMKVLTGPTVGCDGTVPARGLNWNQSAIASSTQTHTVSLYARGAIGGEVLNFGITDSRQSSFTLTTAWQRLTYTGINNLTDYQAGRILQFASTGISTTYYVWGPQVERGPVANSYIPTTGVSTSRTTIVPNFGADLNATGISTNGVGYASYATVANQGCFAFDNTRTAIYTNSVPSTFWNAGSWTASVWAYFNAVDKGNDNAIFGHGTAALNNGLHLGERNRRIYFGFYSNDFQSDQILSANTWYNIVWTYNAITRERRMYLNSSFIINNISNASYAGVSAITSIGTYIWSTTTVTNGLLNNIMLHNKVLTDTEIQRNFNLFRGRYGI